MHEETLNSLKSLLHGVSTVSWSLTGSSSGEPNIKSIGSFGHRDHSCCTIPGHCVCLGPNRISPQAIPKCPAVRVLCSCCSASGVCDIYSPANKSLYYQFHRMLLLDYNSRGLIQQENISTGDVTARGVVQRLSSSSLHNFIQPSRKQLGAVQRRTNWNFSEI